MNKHRFWMNAAKGKDHQTRKLGWAIDEEDEYAQCAIYGQSMGAISFWPSRWIDKKARARRHCGE